MGETEKQGIIVYIWNRSRFHCGHASLDINGNSYISFWPLSPCRKILISFGISHVRTSIFLVWINYLISFLLPFADNKTHTSTYEQDCKILNRSADRQITLHGTYQNPEEIKVWWIQQNHLSYGLVTRNCYTVIFNALKWLGFEVYAHDQEYILWTAERLYMYCEKLQWQTYEERKQNTKTGFIYDKNVRINFDNVLDTRKQEAEKQRRHKEDSQESDMEKDHEDDANNKHSEDANKKQHVKKKKTRKRF